MHSENGKRILNWIGTFLSVISILFIVAKLHSYSGELFPSDLKYLDLIFFALFTVIYGASGILLAAAWGNILAYLNISSDFRRVLRIYGISQVSKYIPGNVFHFFGRQALGLKYGLPGWPLARSAILEIVVITLSGTLFVSFVVPFFWVGIQPVSTIGIFLTVSALVIGFTYRLAGCFLARAVVFELMFLMISGMLFAGVLYTVEPEVFDPGKGISWMICGAFVIGWLLGFLTPGAPAGLGIREVVLLWLLGSAVQEANLLNSVVISRMITVLGDLLFFGYVLLLKTES